MSNQKIPSNLTGLFESAVRVYMNHEAQRNLIREENAGKYGIYCWVNLFNGKIYIGQAAGSVTQLYGRLQDYYQMAYLNHPRNLTSLICRALLKYGMKSFSLLILEYVDTPEEAIAREQHYLYTLYTAYNTQKSAGHSLGLCAGVPQSDAHKNAAWQAQWGNKLHVDAPLYCPQTDNLLAQQSEAENSNALTEITITDLLYPWVYATFYSWRTAADALCIKHTSLLNYVKRETRRPYKGRYLISVTKRSKS